MADKLNAKDLARELYVKNFSLARIADILNKNIKTIRNYKSQDGNWDELKTASYIEREAGEADNIYQNFIEEMRLAVRDVRESDAGAKEKAEALAKIGDSFVKMSKVAGREDPKAYRLSVARRVITLVVDKFRAHGDKEAIKTLVELIESEKFVRAIEEMDV